MADTQVAQFFILKNEANKDYLMTDADFRLILSGYKGWQDRKVAKATTVALEQRFFHWFIEFPEVFSEGGFDCILGNPPYLGTIKFGESFGVNYTNSILTLYSPTGGKSDLAAYFLRRNYSIINSNGFVSIITTNTISQGDSKDGGLKLILNEGGKIIYANSNIKWPGNAAVTVTLFSITKNNKIAASFIGTRTVKSINANLTDFEILNNPNKLISNRKIGLVGSYLYGEGFILDIKDARDIINSDSKYTKVLFPYLNGKDLNDSPDLRAKRYVINFFDWEEKQAKEFPICFKILEETVKIEREKIYKEAKQVHEWDFWKYWDKREDDYKSIKEFENVIVTARTSKTLAFAFVKNDSVYSSNLTILSKNELSFFSIVHSNVHSCWAWEFGTKLKTDLIYAPNNIIETFPFPKIIEITQEQQLDAIGEAYHEHRKQLMLGMQLGLTKTYNLFHSNAITAQSINDKDKQVASLQKHLEKNANTISFDEAIQSILKLRELHVQMDEAVLDAYGWNDIAMKHNFYEVDYLPENDRVRFTIHPDARKEVMKRLLELNHKIHEEEKASGLLDKKKTVNKKSNVVNESQAGYGGLFK